MDLIVDICSHDEPIHRYIGDPKILTDCYFLEVNFAGIEDKDREYWHSLGFAPAFVFPKDDKFMFCSCPLSECRGAYSPKAAYEIECESILTYVEKHRQHLESKI
jgi:hypothetical protein